MSKATKARDPDLLGFLSAMEGKQLSYEEALAQAELNDQEYEAEQTAKQNAQLEARIAELEAEQGKPPEPKIERPKSIAEAIHDHEVLLGGPEKKKIWTIRNGVRQEVFAREATAVPDSEAERLSKELASLKTQAPFAGLDDVKFDTMKRGLLGYDLNGPTGKRHIPGDLERAQAKYEELLAKNPKRADGQAHPDVVDAETEMLRLQELAFKVEEEDTRQAAARGVQEFIEKTAVENVRKQAEERRTAMRDRAARLQASDDPEDQLQASALLRKAAVPLEELKGKSGYTYTKALAHERKLVRERLATRAERGRLGGPPDSEEVQNYRKLQSPNYFS